MGCHGSKMITGVCLYTMECWWPHPYKWTTTHPLCASHCTHTHTHTDKHTQTNTGTLKATYTHTHTHTQKHTLRHTPPCSRAKEGSHFIAGVCYWLVHEESGSPVGPCTTPIAYQVTFTGSELKEFRTLWKWFTPSIWMIPKFQTKTFGFL